MVVRDSNFYFYCPCLILSPIHFQSGCVNMNLVTYPVESISAGRHLHTGGERSGRLVMAVSSKYHSGRSYIPFREIIINARQHAWEITFCMIQVQIDPFLFSGDRGQAPYPVLVLIDKPVALDRHVSPNYPRSFPRH